MPTLSFPTFQGIRPKTAPDLLGPFEAQTAQNCKLHSGQIVPYDNQSLIQLLNYEGIMKTIFLFESSHWLEFEADVDIELAPVSGDTASKFYYMGDGIPKKSNLALATTGSGAKPIKFYPLSVPSPIGALTATPTDSGGSGSDRTITYIWTVVTSWGEEGYTSPASTDVDARNGETVDLTNMTLVWQSGTSYSKGDVVFAVGDEGGTYLYRCVTAGTSGSSEPTWNQTLDGNTFDNTVTWRCYENNLAYKYIYRLSVGDNYALYQYVTSIAISATTYSDSVEDDDLGESVRSLKEGNGGQGTADWDMPLDDLQGLTYMGNGIFLAFKGKDLYACEPYRPWAWPIDYIQSLASPIVSIASSGNTAVVTTQGKPYLVTGTHSVALTAEPLSHSVPCVSKRGTEGHATGAIYPSKNGLYLVPVNGQPPVNLTEKHYDSKGWKALYPSTMHGYIHDNKYFGFYSYGSNEGAIVLDLSTGELTTLSFYVMGAYVDPLTDTLYLIRSIQMSVFNELFLNIAATSTSGKADQFTLNATGSMSNIVQPDVPRNVVLTITDTNASLSALQVTVTGTLATGETGQTEVFTVTAAGNHAGSKAFAHIDSITIDSVTGGEASDYLDLGYGVAIGIGNGIVNTTDILKVVIDDVDDDVGDQTVSTTYDTIEFATAPNGTHDYQVWYKSEVS